MAQGPTGTVLVLTTKAKSAPCLSVGTCHCLLLGEAITLTDLRDECKILSTEKRWALFSSAQVRGGNAAQPLVQVSTPAGTSEDKEGGMCSSTLR